MHNLAKTRLSAVDTPDLQTRCATTEQLARALDASRAMEVPASSSRDYSSWEYVGQRPRRVPHEDTIDPDEPQIKQASNITPSLSQPFPLHRPLAPVFLSTPITMPTQSFRRFSAASTRSMNKPAPQVSTFSFTPKLIKPLLKKSA